MGHTPFGYRIENGTAVIDRNAAEKLRKLYSCYLHGMGLDKAAREAGITVSHAYAKRLLMTEYYLGDGFYPPIIDKETFDLAQAESIRRADALGRLNIMARRKAPTIPALFTLDDITEHYDSPAAQAEYIYSLLRSEVVS